MLETLQAIVAITLIDLAMSGDNALVIGMVARGLPRAQRRKAIVVGAGAAVALRVAAAAAVTLLLTVRYLQLAGGVELLLTVAFLAIVAAARWRHAVLAVVRPRAADPARRAARRERRAS